MLSLKKILPHEYELYADKAVMLEQTYPEVLRSDKADILDMFSRSGAVALAAEEQHDTAGIVIGYPLEAEELDEYHLTGVYQIDKGSIYLESITVSELFRGRGVGLFLIKGFARAAGDVGFRSIVGHFRKNGSLALIKKIGGREINVEENWFDTGEDFIYCEAPLPVRD